ncbi:MAG: fructosamine kinase family protein [Verrucomicrobiota bacterium]
MQSLAELLEDLVGHPVEVLRVTSTTGGCIHGGSKIETTKDPFFVKKAPLSDDPILRAEKIGLETMAGIKTFRMPEVIGRGKAEGDSVLILEWIDIKPLDPVSGARLGESLAEFHQIKGPFHGFEEDNFIGTTPQLNRPTEKWQGFFRESRLQPQLDLAKENGFRLPSCKVILDGLDLFFEGDSIVASPLHGDLCGGNAAADGFNQPVLFDPAFYWGDYETDLALMNLFGGFPAEFFQSYFERIPRRTGWKSRESLYNLYHVLNHLNLFGASYLQTASRMINELSAFVSSSTKSQ